jgi:hypothetical protein
MNNKDTSDSDKELMVAVERDFKCPAQSRTDHFKKLLEVTCPIHTFPVKHKLKECSMMKNCMAMRSLASAKKHESDSVGKAAAPFLEEKAVMSIYGGPAPHESHRKLKLISRAINTVRVATPKYLCWFESSITLDRKDHPDSIHKPGRSPLIVDPLVKTTSTPRPSWMGAVGSITCTLTHLKDWGLP